MPKSTKKSGLAGKLGAKGNQSVKAHSSDETRMGQGSDLPAPINHGIAQLTDCEFKEVEAGKDNAGEYTFYAAGIVLEPTEVKIDSQKIKVQGLRTWISEPMFDTPSRTRETVDEHIDWVMNELRKLGVDTNELNSAADLEAAAAALVEAAPCFKFRTWQSKPTKDYPDPRVNHVWEGETEHEGLEEGEGVEEEGEEEEGGEETAFSEIGAAADGGDEDAQTALAEKAAEVGVDSDSLGTWTEVAEAIEAAGAVEAAEEGEAEEEEGEAEEEEGETYADIGARADEEDEEAAETLTSKCAEVGISENDYATWAEVGAALDEVEAASEGEGEEEETPPAEPEKGDCYQYTPKNRKKPVECEVTAVFKTKKTVTLKSLEDGKTLFKAVPWDQLVG